jgi:site-specific recombinase XerD
MTAKRDIFNKGQSWDNWKNEVLIKGKVNPKYIEEGLTKENSKLLIEYIFNLELKGKAKRTCYEMKNKIKAIIKKFQERGIKDITKVKEKDVLTFFKEWKEEGHSNDYAVRLKSFWAWYMKEQRKKGVVIDDVCMDLDTSNNNDSQFVWIKKEEGELDKLCELLTEEEQLIVRFVMDSIIRSPTEILSLKVEDITKNNKGEVWVNIPKEISKTIGRRFNLVYTGDSIMDYIKRKDLKPNDYLFNFSSTYLNRKLKKVSKQIWGDKKSEAGEYYKNLTLYDFRHSGAIFFRMLFKETGQSIDALRHRGGWTDFKMLNYYTKLLGMDGKIDKEKTLIGEDKSRLENEVEELKEWKKNVQKNVTKQVDDLRKLILQQAQIKR